ncbi:LysM peptidoglycan-binding domain-containing protein [Aquibacillus koreensis]|uniref:LysM peptidoglycan-binding domain-containing protein n=1 Tax=Aquibacillus koreensis TaxID=279446 RepID=A0A9X3WLU1_9BACI|nr:LysM peptidoglycan-binding domain-containing protein [Aquibacillus koreensis]MCT2537675.1 LysM peptidoglycan-binding domain-containing protein [Aquibacillus koreensis]MDC3420978.1 LysM peptidoglycan-binding domain-containing protein [Aquibacillus koreensis]
MKTKIMKTLAPTAVVGLVIGTAGFSVSAETETMEEGETFWDVAQEHNVTVDELMDMNSDIEPRAIPVGTEIELDAEQSTGSNDAVTHTVQPGNTLIGIANVYDGVTLEDLHDLNQGIDPYELMIGSEVTVVHDNNDSTDNSSENGNENSDVVYHMVQPGNTINGIASVYDYVSAEEIMEANPDVDPNDLTIGSEIAIPLD